MVSHKIKMIRGPDLLNIAFDLHIYEITKTKLMVRNLLWVFHMYVGRSNAVFDIVRPRAILILCQPTLNPGCSQNNGNEPLICTKEDNLHLKNRKKFRYTRKYGHQRQPIFLPFGCERLCIWAIFRGMTIIRNDIQ